MTKRKRRHRSAEEKARLLRRHLEDNKVPVSKIKADYRAAFVEWARVPWWP